jgi:hypothetical protein
MSPVTVARVLVVEDEVNVRYATVGARLRSCAARLHLHPTTVRDGKQAAVTLLVPNGSTTKTQLITIGSVGAVYTQVTGGLSAGQRVVVPARGPVLSR